MSQKTKTFLILLSLMLAGCTSTISEEELYMAYQRGQGNTIQTNLFYKGTSNGYDYFGVVEFLNSFNCKVPPPNSIKFDRMPLTSKRENWIPCYINHNAGKYEINNINLLYPKTVILEGNTPWNESENLHNFPAINNELKFQEIR